MEPGEVLRTRQQFPGGGKIVDSLSGNHCGDVFPRHFAQGD
jgi:hypothetical protein